MRPNILFIFSDQQRWDTLGCYGQRLPISPNLDRLASEGVRFDKAFTCQPVCGPARACLQTGKFATQLGTFRNDIALPYGEPTIASRLAETGYETAYVGKWHLASTNQPGQPRVDYATKGVPPELRGGYRDYWMASDVLEFTSHSYDGHVFDGDGNQVEFPPGRYRADALTDYAIDFLRRPTTGRDKPFFMFISYIEPHHQNDHKHFEGPSDSKARWSGFTVPGDLQGTGGDWRQEYPDYLGCCNALDSAVGRLRAELERLRQWENTVVIYTSDHGCHFCTRNGEYKRACHDGCIHIPLIIHGGGFTGGKAIGELASLIDLPATVLAAGGASLPPGLQGRPLQQLLAGAPADWQDDVFIQISESHVGRAIRTQRWKYSVRAPDKDGWNDSCSDSYVEDFLYDLAADPHERNNLIADPSLAAVRSELCERLKRRMGQAGENIPTILPKP